MEDEAWRELMDVEARIEQVAQATLKVLPLRVSARPPEEAGDVTILLADDATVRDLNARFRGKDASTNVLSFPAPETARPHLGDIALAHGACAREAVEQGKLLADHLSHLVVHGVLHLLGYDHQADAPAEVMEAMERDILLKLGVADPYRQDPVHAGP